MTPTVAPLLEQPKDPRESGGGWCCCFAALFVTIFAFCGCCGLWWLAHDAMFVDRVSVESLGWRFQAKYEGLLGRTTSSSTLTYNNQGLDGDSLPTGTHLVIPIGEFIWQSNWDTVWSDPPITSSEYKVSNVAPDTPWVPQIEDSHDIETLIAKGAYRAPPASRRFEEPWSSQQFKGTPADWIYVYRLQWDDGEGGRYKAPAVEGYWVDPARLNELDWFGDPPY